MDKQHAKRAKKKRSNEKSIKFRCDYSSTPLKVLESRGWTRIYDPKDRRWDLWWCDAGEVKLALDHLQRLRAQQRVAHFLNHGELTRKNLLYRNLRRYKRLLLKAGKSREAELCDIMPVSFELPSEYRMLVEEYRRSQGSTWIVKPAAGSQGRGIFLFQRLKDLAEWRSREYPAPSADSNSDSESPASPDIYIVQKYIDDPYLLGGCKFDLRIYVLVTSFQPLKVWLAREGFARLSGEQFSLERIDDSRVHLTNMSIQLKASAASSASSASCRKSAAEPDRPQQPDYERTRPPAKLGSKWPLSCLRQYLTERHGPAVVDDLLHNIADGLTYEDEEGKMQYLAIDSEEVILKPNAKEYYVHHSNEASHIGKTSASESIGKNCNKENELNGTSGINGKCSEESKSNERQEVFIAKPLKIRNAKKTLRVGWLNKAAGETKYRKVTKPRGGVRKLKLDVTDCYLACQIRRMAIDAFEASSSGNSAIEDEYVVNLGDFGGQAITEFRRLKDGRMCDIWEYCEDRGKTLYQLNLFMLTSPMDEDERAIRGEGRTISTRRRKAQPRIVNDVRVLYQYVRRSSYTNELSYIEYDKPELHARVLEDHCGVGPPVERFEPLDYGYAISRIEKSDRVLLQVSLDDDDARSTEFPASTGSLGEHAILHDVDQLQGYCSWRFGLGLVPSCTDACRPLFSWYRDGVLFKKVEYLYWLDNIKDDQPHSWSCTVTCRKTDRQLESKQVLIDGL